VFLPQALSGYTLKNPSSTRSGKMFHTRYDDRYAAVKSHKYIPLTLPGFPVQRSFVSQLCYKTA